MGSTGLGSRLKAQLSKFSLAVSEGLTRPQRKLVQDAGRHSRLLRTRKLSSISRSLQEKVPLIKTEDRLSRNLAAPVLDVHLLQRLAEDTGSHGSTPERCFVWTSATCARSTRRRWSTWARSRRQ